MAGANFVFALNAACFFLVVLAVRQWKQPSAPAKLPTERFFKSFGTVILLDDRNKGQFVFPWRIAHD
jgi:hypothetical protein